MPAPLRKAPQPSVGPFQIQPSPVEFIEISFRRGSATSDPAEVETPQVDVVMGLDVRRAAPATVDVVLTLEIDSPSLAAILIRARSLITVEVNEDVEVDLDSELAKVAAQIGPVVIFPYVREMVAELTRRGGLHPVMLPVYQMGRMFEVSVESIQPETSADVPPKSKREKRGKSKQAKSKKA